jgi:hypothetical protein
MRYLHHEPHFHSSIEHDTSYVSINGMKIFRGVDYIVNPDGRSITITGSKLSLCDLTKPKMVEVMKNHGLKFNKSKKKVELWKIFNKSV